MAVNLEQELLQAKRRITELQAENERLRAVYEAAELVVRDLDLMNLPGSCPKLRKALATLEDNDDLS